MKNFLNAPFFRSQSGQVFLWAHVYTGFLALLALAMWLGGLNGWSAVRLALWSEVVIYLISVVGYRAEVWYAGRS